MSWYSKKTKHSGKQRFWGKYRGKVLDNIDPLFQGRIIAKVPAVSGSLLNWALPCTPYAGPDEGFYAIPPKGADVWIEFEGGDPDYPIWVGCFWAPEDVLHVPEPVVPELKVFKTAHTTIVINDVDELGGAKIAVNPPAVEVPLEIEMNAEGIKLSCPEATIQMTPASITHSVPEAVTTMEAANISMTVPESVIDMTPETISITVPASSIDLTAAVVETESVEVSMDGEVNMMPVVTVEGENNIAGAQTIEGDQNVAGAVEIEGGAVIAGGGVIDGAPII